MEVRAIVTDFDPLHIKQDVRSLAEILPQGKEGKGCGRVTADRKPVIADGYTMLKSP